MPKKQNAYLMLRKAILDCELAPDSPLVISSLKARFGFGWTPLREALSRLEAEELVLSEQNKGYRVAPVSKESLLDLQLARQTLERSLLERSVARGDDTWEANVVAAHHLLAQAPPPIAGLDLEAIEHWEQRHRAFHDSLLAAAEAPWSAGFADRTADHLHRHHRAMLYSSGVLGEGSSAAEDSSAKDGLGEVFSAMLGLDHHTRLMTAALSRNRDLALELLDEHVGFSVAVYQAL